MKRFVMSTGGGGRRSLLAFGPIERQECPAADLTEFVETSWKFIKNYDCLWLLRSSHINFIINMSQSLPLYQLRATRRSYFCGRRELPNRTYAPPSERMAVLWVHKLRTQTWIPKYLWIPEYWMGAHHVGTFNTW